MLYSSFRESALRYPDKPAVRQEARSISYRDLDRQMRLVSSRLRESGVARGSVIATCLDSQIETIAVYYGVARVGAQVATLDSYATPEELTRIIEMCRPVVVICEPRHLQKLTDTLRQVTYAPLLISAGTQPLDWDALFSGEVSDSALDSTSPPEAGAFHITFTSGSTGRPKGIVLSQRALRRRITDWIELAQLTPQDEHLCPLTLSHAVGPQYGCFPALATGGTLHLMEPTRISPLRVLRYLHEHRITHFCSLPYFHLLLASVSKLDGLDLSALRIVMSVAAPLPADTARRFLEKFGLTLWNCYGLSECGVILVGQDQGAALGGAAIGKPLRGVEIRLLERGHEQVGSADASAGEIAVRSETLADGNYYIVSRLSHFINVGGNKVAPIEIEAVIGEIPGVREVAVIGAADPRMNQKVVAFVVADAPLSVDRVQQQCRQRLASFKVPSVVAFRKQLPKSTLGKILKPQLRVPTGEAR